MDLTMKDKPEAEENKDTWAVYKINGGKTKEGFVLLILLKLPKY